MAMFKVNDELIEEKSSRLTSVEWGCVPFLRGTLTFAIQLRKEHGNTSVRVVVKCQFGHDSMCQHGRLAGRQDKLSTPKFLL